MEFDVFFSISQTPVNGSMPDEATMFANWLSQVEAADQLGYGVAWLAESHLSSEVQKTNEQPVIPHWDGEVGLNCDMLQSAHVIFQRTAALASIEQSAKLTGKGRGRLRRGQIEVGSAVMNILQGGGPIAAAERIAYFASMAQLDHRPGGMSRKPDGTPRKIHVGFSAGRFDYMNRAHGYVPRDDLERAIPYPFLKGKIFHEATEIFCRLLAGETISSQDIPARTITEAECRSPEDWDSIVTAGEAAGVVEMRKAPKSRDPCEHVVLPKRFEFEALKIVPAHWPRDLVQLVAGSHDPTIAELANRFLPCQVANLSITPPHIIEKAHEKMAKIYHKEGGRWQRRMMPRTVMVFLNDEDGLTVEDRREHAQAEAKAALGAYWNALTGTLDPKKIENAADNAVIGNAEDVASQLRDRYHPDDRIMLWFDFFTHDSERVIRNMTAFKQKVVPLLEA